MKEGFRQNPKNVHIDVRNGPSPVGERIKVWGFLSFQRRLETKEGFFGMK